MGAIMPLYSVDRPAAVATAAAAVVAPGTKRIAISTGAARWCRPRIAARARRRARTDRRRDRCRHVDATLPPARQSGRQRVFARHAGAAGAADRATVDRVMSIVGRTGSGCASCAPAARSAPPCGTRPCHQAASSGAPSVPRAELPRRVAPSRAGRVGRPTARRPRPRRRDRATSAPTPRPRAAAPDRPRTAPTPPVRRRIRRRRWPSRSSTLDARTPTPRRSIHRHVDGLPQFARGRSTPPGSRAACPASPSAPWARTRLEAAWRCRPAAPSAGGSRRRPRRRSPRASSERRTCSSMFKLSSTAIRRRPARRARSASPRRRSR